MGVNINLYAIPRKKRKSQAIQKSEKIFSEALHNKDYKKASAAVFWCVLVDFAKQGIMDALDHGNSFYERKEFRRGL